MISLRSQLRGLVLLTFGVSLSGPAILAQGVTLPSARVVGPSPAVQQLLQLFEDAGTWISATDTNAKKHDALELVRYRLLLSPFRCKELTKIMTQPRFKTIWTTLYEDVLHSGNRGLAVAVWARTHRGHVSDSTETDLITFAISGAYKDSAGRLVPTAPPKKAIPVDAKTTDSAKPPSCSDRLTPRGGDDELSPVSERETSALAALVGDGQDETLRARLDTLARLAQLVVIERKLRQGLLPVHTTEQARVFWRQQGISPLNLASLTGNGSSGAAFTELAAPFLNGVRLSLNTVLASSNKTPSTSTESTSAAGATTKASGDETELTRFLNGGGQLNVGASLPLLFAGRRDGVISLMILAAPRVSATVGALGAIAQDNSAFVDPAIEIHLASSDAVEHVGFFTQARTGYASGGAKFGEALGLGNGTGFAYTNFAAGLVFGGRYLLTGGRTLMGPASLQRMGWQVGVTVFRGGQ